MRVVSLSAILLGLIIAACAGSAIAPGPTATPTPTAPTPVATPVPTPAFLDPDEAPALTLQDIFPPRELSTLRLGPSRASSVLWVIVIAP